MTLAQLGLYALAMAVLTITPGPVWVATIARALAGGFRQAWPLAIGVALGDAAWTLLALLGVGWVAGTFGGVMAVARWVAAGLFVWLGLTVLRHAGAPVGRDRRLTAPGRRAGFVAGLVVIVSNPKAVLFYMGFLPGFFDLARLTPADIAAITLVSVTVPLLGNLGLALAVARARGLFATPAATRRLNLAAGLLLLAVGLVIPVL